MIFKNNITRDQLESMFFALLITILLGFVLYQHFEVTKLTESISLLKDQNRILSETVRLLTEKEIPLAVPVAIKDNTELYIVLAKWVGITFIGLCTIYVIYTFGGNLGGMGSGVTSSISKGIDNTSEAINKSVSDITALVHNNFLPNNINKYFVNDIILGTDCNILFQYDILTNYHMIYAKLPEDVDYVRLNIFINNIIGGNVEKFDGIVETISLFNC